MHLILAKGQAEAGLESLSLPINTLLRHCPHVITTTPPPYPQSIVENTKLGNNILYGMLP